MRKRASTVSVPLAFGQHHTTAVWLHDPAFHAGDVIINTGMWPGISKGDLIQVTPADIKAEVGHSFLFLVDDGSVNNAKTQVPHISIIREVGQKFGFTQSKGVTLTKIDPSTVEANVIEIYFRDMYMGRRDMWRLCQHLTGRPVYAGQKTNFFSTVGATIKCVYIDGIPLESSIVTTKTRAVIRSLSARSTIFISVCRELWEFADDGECFYEKIVHSFFPALIRKWRDSSTKHVVAIVLFSRVFYEESELDYAAGPLRQDDEGRWYKDFYKVVVDIETIRDWKPSLVTLKESFFAFQRDILFNHHYHQNQRADFSSAAEDPLRRLVGHLSYAHEGPILEAINLGLNPTDLHFVDRSLSLTGCSIIVITPGTGHFRVSKTFLRFTTSRLLYQGYRVDLVCLAKAPLHRSPLFSFKGVDPELSSRDPLTFAYHEKDPLWIPDPTGWTGEMKLFYWEPFWMVVSFWDIQADQPFRTDRFVPRARMPEIQMLGLLEHDVSSTIEIPYTQDPGQAIATYGSMSAAEARLAREQFDHDVFAKHARSNAGAPSRAPYNVIASNYDPRSYVTPASPPVLSLVSSRMPVDGSRSRTLHSPREPIILEESSGNSQADPARASSSVPGLQKRRSRSKDSMRSVSSSVSQTSSARRKSVALKFGAPTWLLTSFRSGPSQAQATPILANKDETKVETEAPATSSAAASLSGVQALTETSATKARREARATRPSGTERVVTKSLNHLTREESSLVSTRRRILAYPLLNPARPSLTLPRPQSILAQRWKHALPGPTFVYDVKWVSMCSPACQPLTTEYYPSQEELSKMYVDHSYDVHLGKEALGSFLLRKDPTRVRQDWPLLVLREMVGVRFIQGFQLIVQSSQPRDKHASEAENTAIVHSALPVGVADVLMTSKEPVFLSLGNHIHRLVYEPIEELIRVNRYIRKADEQDVQVIDYECLVWPKLGEGYTDAKTSFVLPDLDAFGWNRLDLTITGYHRDFGDLVRHWRTRYLIIPSEIPPVDMYGESGEKLTDEECRLLGTDRLAELFGKARWLGPGETMDSYSPPRFLYTWLDPPACLLDAPLMETLNQVNATAALGKPRTSDKDMEGMSLASIAQAMREDDTLVRDRHWNRTYYTDTFTGYEFVSWLVRTFRDVSTRQQAVEWGIKLQGMDLFTHVRKEHSFMDGHYFYILTGEYAAPPRSPARWFRSLKPINDESSGNPDTPSVFSTGGRRGKAKKIHTLSQTIIIDADPSKRSDRAECLILHHDIIQNPDTAFHFEFHWVGTAGRCIDDLLQHWSRVIARFGLKLVEGYVDPILHITDKNIFQSCFPIRLAIPPPMIPDLRLRLVEGSSYAWYFEYAILRRFGYILDIESKHSYPDSVHVFYSYRRTAAFAQSQFIHQSGLAFVQVLGGTEGEGFAFLTNRLLTSSSPFPAGGRGSQLERTAHERADTLRLDLLAFCSDAKQLAAFYDEVVANLPPPLVDPSEDEFGDVSNS